MFARRRSDLVVLGCLAGAIFAALAPGLRIRDAQSLATFAGFIFLTGLFDVELVGGRKVSLSLAPAVGYALLGAPHPCTPPSQCPPAPGLGEVALAFAAAVLLATAVRAALSRSVDAADVLSRFLLVVTAGAVYRWVHAGAGELGGFGNPPTSAPGLVAALATVLVLEAAFEALRGAGDGRPRGARAWLGALRETAPIYIAMTSVGALLSLAYPQIGAWSLPLFVAPLAATQYAFRQFAQIRTTYVQTVRALARVPEMAGYTTPDHSRIVAALSVAMAQELGLPDNEVAEVEYAALLHDIGRVALPDPEDRADDTTYRLQLALVGAGIVEETGYFPNVAMMIRLQNEPYRRRGEDVNHDLLSGAKIIKVASAYDDMTRPVGAGRTSWDALERLHAGMAYEYDPTVIQALTRVLERNRVFERNRVL